MFLSLTIQHIGTCSLSACAKIYRELRNVSDSGKELASTVAPVSGITCMSLFVENLKFFYDRKQNLKIFRFQIQVWQKPACIFVCMYVCTKSCAHFKLPSLWSQFQRRIPKGDNADNLNRQSPWFKRLCITQPKKSVQGHLTWLTGPSDHCLNLCLCRKLRTMSFKCLSIMKTYFLAHYNMIYKTKSMKNISMFKSSARSQTVSENLKITHENFWRLWQTSCFFVLGGGKSWIHAQCREHSVNSVAADCYWIVQNIRWQEYVIINKLFTGQSITNSDGAPGILL